MRLPRLVMLVALLLVAVAPARAAAPEDPTCSRLVVALFDLTGSFTRWLPRAIAHGRQVIARLQPGDCLLARPIGTESFQIENRLTVRVPRRLRPIDPAFERRLHALKADGQRLLPERLAGRPAPSTDVWGALAAAGQTLSATPARERWLLVYSDLDHTAPRASGGAGSLRLPEVHVSVLFIPRAVEAPRFHDRLRAWAAAFRQAGAREVQFSDTDLFPLEVLR